MSVVNMVVGGTTPDGATFVTKVDGGGPVRVAVMDSDPAAQPLQQVTIRAWGAQGGGGGLGGFTEGTFSVLGGTVLNVRVGGQGVAPTSQTGQTDPGAGFAGGFNGGGTGGYYFDDFNAAGVLRMGGSGGGGSDVRWDGDTLADRQIVGGGGGGASTHGSGTGGAGGGTNGGAGGSGPNTGAQGGGGGTASAGGAGGTTGSGGNGGDGASGTGGAGGVFVTLGNNGGGPGGGGGGLFGGGGGKSASGFGEAGGGGGGSGFVDPAATGTDLQVGVRSGHGRVEIEVGGIVTVFDHIGGPDTFEVPGAAPNVVFTASQAVDAQGVAKVSIAGLDPATRYWWQVEDGGVLDTSVTGQFLTHPPLGLPGSFTLALASCAGGNASVPSAGTAVTDTFTRTVVDGWGDTDTGQTWIVAGGVDSDYAVSGGIATHSEGEAGGATRRSLLAVDHSDLAATWAVSIPEAASGNTAQAGMIAREAGDNLNFYIFRVVFLTNTNISLRISIREAGSETTLFQFTPPELLGYTPGGLVNVRCVAVGTQLMMRGWFDGDPEPGYWQAEAQDSTFALGQRLGLRSGLETGWAGTTPLTFSYDNVEIATQSELAPTRVSNHPVFATIADRGVAEEWSGFHHLGDATYYDPGSGEFVPDASLLTYRTMWDDILTQPNQARMMRQLPFGYIWDDHDFGPNNSDGTHVDKANAAQVARERLPLAFAEPAGPIYRTWQVGRVRFVAWDVRYDRSPNSDPDGPSKTMLGSAQKAWMEGLLAAPGSAEFLVILSGSQWMHPDGIDTWASFATERDELVEMFGDHGWLNRMCMVYGDRHAAGIDSGGSNAFGGFPVLQAASLDSTPSTPPIEGLFDTLEDTPGRDQYGTISVTDLGSAIQVRLSAWRGETLLGSHSFAVALASAAPIASSALLRTLAGSHRPVFEARVLSSFQTGDDPTGTTIPIIDGQVELDGTADVERTLTLATDAVFPRRIGDLLLPDGTELFVRRGVDLGSQILWTPLGYYRLDDDDQGDAPDGPIALTAFDRMKGIIDGELLSPRQFSATATFGSVFAELVSDVYPDAVIVFDDDLGQETIGRLLVVERSRYQALRTLAQGRGKIMHWDDVGALRIETAPDPDVPVWEVKAGASGVLTQASRRVTRRDVINAVVVRSQGGDTLAPARAVAIDDGPSSITRFGGRFGQVPAFITTPVESSNAQVQEAARQTLLRRAGLPYQMSFRAVPNPTLRPFDPVRVTLRDGTREKHVMERLSIPLRAEPEMTGRTREQRSSRVVVVPQ